MAQKLPGSGGHHALGVSDRSRGGGSAYPSVRSPVGIEPHHVRDEAIAAPHDRLDAASLRPALVEDAAQRSDVDGEVAVLDDRALPHGIGNFILRNQAADPFDQQGKDVERTRAQGDGNLCAVFAAPEQTAPGAVEAKVSEQEYTGMVNTCMLSPAEVADLEQDSLHRFGKIRKNSDPVR